MKLKVLADNNTCIDKYYLGEPAVSYYIEDGDTKILFDTGYSDVFIKNALKLGVDLNDIDYIVISHGHNDHTGGLSYYLKEYKNNKVSIIAHPDAIKEKYLDNEKISASISVDEINKKGELILSKEAKKISENIFFLGEIPRKNDFEGKESIGRQKDTNGYLEDYILDDTALVYKSDLGIYIITGCSHSGICNIIEHAKLICNDYRVLGVLGGFHLFSNDNKADKTIKYLVDQNIKEIYPCHCTSFKVKSKLNAYIEVKEVWSGLELEW